MKDTELISSTKHPAITRARADLSKVVDDLHSAYPVEGFGMLSQALEAGVTLDAVFFREPAESDEAQAIAERLRPLGVEVYRVTPGVFQRIMGLGYETSIGVLATAVPTRVVTNEMQCLLSKTSVVLVGERIQDPRNVGVLIRNADALGVSLVVFGSSADAFSRASVRSTTGSIFRVPVMQTQDLAQPVAALKETGVSVIGTSAGAHTAVSDAEFTPPCAVVVGNESVGLSETLREQCDELVRIPMCGGAHSLNVTVAAGILLYEAARRA